MKKGIGALKYNSRLKFSRFVGKLQATNYCIKVTQPPVLFRGVFRGGHWAIAPLWVARIAKLHRKVSKIEACPPPLQAGHQGLGSKAPDIGRKIGRNLSEDLFFALHLILG